MMNKVDISCLTTVLSNRQELPRFVPRNRRQFLETEDLLQPIIQSCQAGKLSNQERSDLYFLNSYIIGKLGKKLHHDIKLTSW